jgi:DNA polymerase III epsilon subunit-like protein
MTRPLTPGITPYQEMVDVNEVVSDEERHHSSPLPMDEEEQRKAIIQDYAKQTGMRYLPLMFADKKEIEEKCADDVKAAEEFDRAYESSKKRRRLVKKSSLPHQANAEEEEKISSPETKSRKSTKDLPRKRKRIILESEEESGGSTTASLSSSDSNSDSGDSDDEEDDALSKSSHDHDVIIFRGSGKGSSRSFSKGKSHKSNDEEDFHPIKRAKVTKKQPAGLERYASSSSSPKRSTYTSVYTNAIVPQVGDELKGTFIIYDTETTTLSPKCGGRLCELAAIKLVNGVPRETLHLYLNPDMKSWDGAFKAHGLHESFLRAQSRFYQSAKTIEDFFGDHLRCAHNGFKFDDPYLMFEMRRARAFYYFKKMIDPKSDLGPQAPQAVHLDELKATQGHEVLKKFGVVSLDGSGPQINNDQRANTLAAAAMLYYFKDHMQNKVASNEKPGPMMFLNGKIMPDPESQKAHYEAATNRLAWFRLIRAETETFEQRQKLRLPHEKSIRDAIALSEKYIAAVMTIFQQGILNESEFRSDIFDPKKMFDTLVYVREHKDRFVRGFNVDNMKLDSLLDYYGINRYDRETGTHGAGIDTNLLFQAVRKLLGATGPQIPYLQQIYAQPQIKQEEHFFQKNSLRRFDESGRLLETIQLHDDGIRSMTHERSGHSTTTHTPSVVFTPATNPYSLEYIPTVVPPKPAIVTVISELPQVFSPSAALIQPTPSVVAPPTLNVVAPAIANETSTPPNSPSTSWRFLSWLSSFRFH